MKKKLKGGKKFKGSSKRKVSVSSDEEQLSIAGSLPPAVEGQLRCFLRVSVGKIAWAIPYPPDDVKLRIKWWGEKGQGALLRPLKKKGAVVNADTQWSSVRYPVCSGPKQFAAYLKDMGSLIGEMVHGQASLPLGQVLVPEIVNLTASHPIRGFFPVMSPSRPSSKVAEVHVAVKFESVSAAYNKFSSSIPTVDTSLDNKENVHEDAAPHPTPPPYASPATPVTHPRHYRLSNDPFASPAPPKGVKFSADPPEQHEYTIDPAVLSLLDSEPDQGGTETGQTAFGAQVPTSTALPASNDADLADVAASYQSGDVSGGMDWIGTLLERGQKLREGMVKTALLDDGDDQDYEYVSNVDSLHGRHHVLPGQLFKEILSKDRTHHSHFISDPLDHTLDHVGSRAHQSIDDHTLDAEDKAIDLLIGDHDMGYLPYSSDASDVSDELSEMDDGPLYDESLLKDLFYTTPEKKTGSDSDLDQTISTDDDDDISVSDDDDDDDDDDDANLSISIEDAGNMRPRRRPREKSSDRKKASKQKKILFKKKSTEDSKMRLPSAENSAHHYNEDTTSTLTSVSSAGSTVPGSSVSVSRTVSDLVDRLGADTLTVLGRVNTARVIIESLEVIHDEKEVDDDGKRKKPSTFLVEYHFPAISPAKEPGHDVAMATEVTRIASKKFQDGAISFGHRSVFPIFFNASIVEQWWSLALTFRVFRRDSGQKQPQEIGVGALPLKSILQSSSLSHTTGIPINQKRRTSSDESSPIAMSSLQWITDSDSSNRGKAIVGNLKVKVELGVDGSKVHITPRSASPTLPTAQPHPPSVAMVTRPLVIIAGSHDGQQCSSSHGGVTAKPPLPRGSSQLTDKPAHHHTHKHTEVHTLHSLLWIPEGNNITTQPHSIHGDQTLAPGIITGRTNPYLVCRMFWCEDVSRSAVTWATNQPRFGFKQVAPVLLTPTLLQRACNNFIVIEVWDKSVPQGDKLIGIAKLPLHQLYLSFRDPKITKTLLKSKYPVVCVDDWCTISNPFTSTQHGKLKVLLAIGTDEQISSLLVMRGEAEVSTTHQDKPQHHLDSHRDAEQTTSHQMTRSNVTVEHQFEVVVEDIRGLSLFRSTVWGETDCFVQYHFPHQDYAAADNETEDVASLKAHRTTTTLCVPDPSFQDIARHAFFLPAGIPVQRYLLASFSGSWSGMPSHPGMGGVPFELWRRYYYPNVRDQLVAKASLPVAKLCAMVTMQKHREPSLQAFSLPLVVLPGDAQDGGKPVVQDTGLLNITVKYRCNKVASEESRDGLAKKGPDQVCLSVDVIRACGLKAAAAAQASNNSSMAYPSDVGVNAYVVVKLPIGRKSSYTTRTVARSFAPEFSHHMEILVPTIITRKGGRHDQEATISLAEQLETSDATLEVWHQLSRGPSDVDQRREDQTNHSREDVLLGSVTIPLVELLTRRTGLRGWYSILPPDKGGYHSNRYHSDSQPVGGLQIALKFAESDDREAVVHSGRNLGWCPPPAVESDGEELWGTGDDDDPSARGIELRLKMSRAWVPVSIARDLQGHVHSQRRDSMGYVRYKLYDKSPICSRLVPVKESDKESCYCDVKHSRHFLLPTSSSLAWFLREEFLEVQVWLGERGASATLPGKRDRLIGSAYVDLSPLAVQHRQRAEVSGIYPLFKTGVDSLTGGSVHVQVSSRKPTSSTRDHAMQEQDEAIDDSVSTGYPSTDLGRPNDNSSSSRSSGEPSDTPQHQNPTPPSTPPGATSEDKDTFAAHVVVQEARHLPLVSGANRERVAPNVYVSYQPTSSSPPVCTPLVRSSTSPLWEYQKLERLKLSTLKTQNLVFKVWHREDVDAKDDSRRVVGKSSADDRALGFVSVDLSPLSAGLRELIGWYNVMAFSGECKGQIKVGVIPLTPVSPSRCLSTKSRLIFSPPRRSGGSQMFSAEIPPTDHTTTQEDRSGLVDLLSNQISVHVENLKRLRSTGVTQTTSPEQQQTARSVDVPAPSCSTSFLFSQLRRNMNDLEELQQHLKAKLRPDFKHHGSTGISHSNLSHQNNDEFISQDTLRDDPKRSILRGEPAPSEPRNPPKLYQVSGKDISNAVDEELSTGTYEKQLVSRDDGQSDFPEGYPARPMFGKTNTSKCEGSIFPYSVDKESSATTDELSQVQKAVMDTIGDMFPGEDVGEEVRTIDQQDTKEFGSQRLHDKDDMESTNSEELDIVRGGDSNLLFDCESDQDGGDTLGSYQGLNTGDAFMEDSYHGLNTGDRFMEKDSWLSNEADETKRESKTPVSAREVLRMEDEFNSEENQEHEGNQRDNQFAGGIDEEKVRNEAKGFREGSDDDSDIEEAMRLFTNDDKTHERQSLEHQLDSPDRVCPDHYGNSDVDDTNRDAIGNSYSQKDINYGASGLGGGQSSAALPNFFMPTQQLEQSMRALRLDAKLGRPCSLSRADAKPHSKLLDRAYLGGQHKDNEGVAKEFEQRKRKYKAKRDDCPPISSLEADRIARIFSSKGV